MGADEAKTVRKNKGAVEVKIARKKKTTGMLTKNNLHAITEAGIEEELVTEIKGSKLQPGTREFFKQQQQDQSKEQIKSHKLRQRNKILEREKEEL
jgi:hypothetical protein